MWVIAAFWFPEFDLWHVSPNHPTAEVIALSRGKPTRDVLIELGQIDMRPPSSPDSNGATTHERQVLELSEVAEPKEGVAQVLATFKASTDLSKRRLPLIPYHTRVTYLLIVALTIQELLVFALRRRLPRLAPGLRIVSVLEWSCVGVWLTSSYLVAG